MLVLSRCPACQLQLCKGRNEPPHAGLVGAASSPTETEKHFTCQKCGSTMINSRDIKKLGWRHQKT
jgi:hypothetical protein